MRRRSRCLMIVLALACGGARAPLGAQQTDTLPLGPVPHPAGAVVRTDSATRSGADSLLPLPLGAGCQVARGTLLGLGGYLGWDIGALTELPVVIWGGPHAVVVGAEAIGVVAGLVWLVDAPLSRRVPLCPTRLRRLSNRPSTGMAGCRASQVVFGLLGFSVGATMVATADAGAGAIGGFLSGTSPDAKTMGATSAVAAALGAVGGVLLARRQSLCRDARRARGA